MARRDVYRLCALFLDGHPTACLHAIVIDERGTYKTAWQFVPAYVKNALRLLVARLFSDKSCVTVRPELVSGSSGFTKNRRTIVVVDPHKF